MHADSAADRLVILGDSCDQATKDWIEGYVGIFGDPDKTEYQWDEGLGNSGSFINAAALALTTEDGHILFAEDDYLWVDGCKAAIQEGMEQFSCFSLYDHPDKYSEMYLGGESCRVVKTASHHWRTTISTTMTFFMSKVFLQENFSRMHSYCTGPIPNDHRMWVDMIRSNYNDLYVALTPLCTHSEKKWLSPFRDWPQFVNDMRDTCERIQENDLLTNS